MCQKQICAKKIVVGSYTQISADLLITQFEQHILVKNHGRVYLMSASCGKLPNAEVYHCGPGTILTLCTEQISH